MHCKGGLYVDALCGLAECDLKGRQITVALGMGGITVRLAMGVVHGVVVVVFFTSVSTSAAFLVWVSVLHCRCFWLFGLVWFYVVSLTSWICCQ
jgi:hypothetical protein